MREKGEDIGEILDELDDLWFQMNKREKKELLKKKERF